MNPPLCDASPHFSAGDVLVFQDGRRVRVLSAIRDHRKRLPVRNVETNRLGYIPEWRLLKAKREVVTERHPAYTPLIQYLDRVFGLALRPIDANAIAAILAENGQQATLDRKNLADVLCCVSQIFNGWRGDECWSQFDEETAQRVVAIQRQLEDRGRIE